MPVTWNEEEAMFEAEVPVECLKDQKQQRLLAVDPGMRRQAGKQ